jgi:hypothetical protein
VYNVAGSGSNDERDKRVISSDLEPQLLDERFLDARDKSLDRCNSFESIETSSPSAQAPKGEKIPNQESFAKELTARANGLIKGTNTEDGFAGSQRRRRHGSRGRMSHDLDSCTGTEKNQPPHLLTVNGFVHMMILRVWDCCFFGLQWRLTRAGALCRWWTRICA